MFDALGTGKRIAALRRRRGMTQETLAALLHVSPQAVSKWENGRAMPELSVLAAMCEIFTCAADALLWESVPVREGASFEHLLRPYAPIQSYSGAKWPRSLGKAALMSAVKLFMGLEERRDPMGVQVNDDAEYILQAACTGVAFGYSWARETRDDACWAMYGLRCEVYKREQCSDAELIRLAVQNINSGYPVIVQPHGYEDVLLATGYVDEGHMLLALPFLDGDDDKNAVMSFSALHRYADWYAEEVDLLLLRPAEKMVTVADACRRALQEGYALLTNTEHHCSEPLVGHGLVIYDNWICLLEQENAASRPTIASLYPHIFIHYEGKLRTKQFLERCLHAVPDINAAALKRAIAKYGELVTLCERVMPRLLTEKPENPEAVKTLRQGLIQMLMRSRELELEAMAGWRFCCHETEA